MLTALWILLKWTAIGFGVLCSLLLVAVVGCTVAALLLPDPEREKALDDEEELIAHGDAILRAMEDDL